MTFKHFQQIFIHLCDCVRSWIYCVSSVYCSNQMLWKSKKTVFLVTITTIHIIVPTMNIYILIWQCHHSLAIQLWTSRDLHLWTYLHLCRLVRYPEKRKVRFAHLNTCNLFFKNILQKFCQQSDIRLTNSTDLFHKNGRTKWKGQRRIFSPFWRVCN